MKLYALVNLFEGYVQYVSEDEHLLEEILCDMFMDEAYYCFMSRMTYEANPDPIDVAENEWYWTLDRFTDFTIIELPQPI